MTRHIYNRDVKTIFQARQSLGEASLTDLEVVRIPASADVTARSTIRTGIIFNPKSHHNRRSAPPPHLRLSTSVIAATPRTKAELADVLAGFAREGIDLLVIDGGDGTVRDVLSCARTLWGSSTWPRLAIVPSGKTNALALDLGIPKQWSIEQALEAAYLGRVAMRRPIEVGRPGGLPPLRGFLFGAGAFVDATALAQRTHGIGAFNGVAVGLALGWSVLQTVFGGASSPWRTGARMRIRRQPEDSETIGKGKRYLFLASTLTRLPVGLKPFGQPRPGLKTLTIDAPPQRIATAVPALLAGSEADWLKTLGYHRVDTEALDLVLAEDFILDGEHYPGGHLTLRHAPPLTFVVP